MEKTVAVLSADVVHHLVPAGVAEVHVDIRHTHPLRVEEALEVQPVLHWQKSMSISGSEIRSGLRKRSNRRSYLMGSILVMPRQ